MALTEAEKKEMAQLQREVGPSPKKSGGLTPEEQAEMQSLEGELADEDLGLLDKVKKRWNNIRSTPDRAPQELGDYNEGATTVEHFANGAMLGYLPQVQAAAQKPIFGLMNMLKGTDVEPDRYVDARDANIERLAKQAEINPKAAMGGELAGMAAGSMVIPAPMPKFLEGTGAGIKGLGRAMGKGAVYGGEYGAVANPGDVQGEVAPMQLGERIGKSIEGAESGAKFGGGLNLLGKTIGAAPKVAKVAMSTLLGPSTKNIDYYLKNSEAVNGAKSIEELKGKVDEIVGGLRGEVEKGKMSVAEAKEALKEVERKIADSRKESNFNYSVTKTQVNQALRDAREELSKAVTGKVQELKDVKAPLGMADDVVAAGKDLRDKNVIGGSQKAMETLGPSDTAKTYSVYKELKALHNGMNIGGIAPGTPEAKAAQSSIKNLMDLVSSLPGELRPDEAKKFLRQLDDSERAVYGQPGFTGDVSKAYKAVRQNIDAQLKSNPAYAAAMKPVAEARGLMDMIPGDKSSALSLLNRIASPTNTVEREALAKLGKLTGRDFETGVAQYLDAQGKLKDPKFMRQLEESLPEFERLKGAESASRMLEGPEAQREFLENNLKGSGLLDRRKEAEGLLDRQSKGLLSAESKAEPFMGITEGTSEGKLKGLLRAKPNEQIELGKQFQELSKLSDTDFIKAVDDLRVKDAFNSSRFNGSRNVNLFSIILGGVGAAVGGGIGGPVGAAAGAALGGTADLYGPKIAKTILDGVIKMGKNPSIQAIQRLNIPQEAKSQLLRQFVQYQESNPSRGLLKSAGQPAATTVTEGYEQ